jgi:hypothetical protein
MKPMHQLTRIDEAMLPTLAEMFGRLGEPPQTLTADSPQPLVIHRKMGQLTLVAAGAGYISLDGAEHMVQAGDLAVLSRDCPHAFRTDSRLELRHWHWPQEYLETDRSILQAHYSFRLGSSKGADGSRG